MTKGLIDKGRPELGQAAHLHAAKLGAHRVPVSKPRDPSRASVQTQLAATQKAIDYNLKLITRLVSRGRFDQAGKVCEIVTRQRMRRMDLIRKRNDMLAQPAVPEPAPRTRQSRTRALVKVKRYKMFSDNPK